jgi:thymidylate synthase (FAD)
MKLTNNHIEVLELSGMSYSQQIEKIGRICYKPRLRTEDGSDNAFMCNLKEREHYSLLEQGTVYLAYNIHSVKCKKDNIKTKYTRNRYSQVNTVDDNIYITTNYRVICENHYERDLNFETYNISQNQPKRISVKIICNKDVSHELTKHRAFSFAQEGTRYSHYVETKPDRELTFIKPYWYRETNDHYFMNEMNKFKEYLQKIEDKYLSLLDNDYTLEDARAILPNCLKTELVMTGFLSDWQHFIKSRYVPTEQPEMIAIMTLIKRELRII